MAQRQAGRERRRGSSTLFPRKLQVFQFWVFCETSGYQEHKRYQCNLPVRSVVQSFLCISSLLWLPSQEYRNRSVNFLGVEYNVFCIVLFFLFPFSANNLWFPFPQFIIFKVSV